ncbi:metal dependent phosphohydrolase [Firmicutes bacterium CAG:882]|jgi:HD-GYP domain-containing protein (c-di-GMP phosphodiesterase class II)|nr:metal dependent phosphohydrolase [Firmicutes bacterium CAG:882]
MAVISSKNMYDILRKSFSILNPQLMHHSERTAYILYKMLLAEGRMNNQEMADYVLIALLHDIGTCKLEYIDHWAEYEKNDVWPHSIYGFLFLKYLSPLESKAEVVLYHHLDYNKHYVIKSQYIKIAEYLFMADKMDVVMSMPGTLESDYLQKYRNIKFSAEALALFLKANAQYKVLDNLKHDDYLKELDELIASVNFSEEYKRKFLQMLVYIIDFRSEHTVIHTLATTIFAQELGEMMHLTAQEKYNLYYGALLHDIGKIAIPLSILEAPGRLTPKEMDIMKKHVEITDHILTGIVDDDVREIAIRHHEKIDGSGYFRGLKGEQLTKPQRIVAVADIISALYGKRSYKEAFDIDKIKEIIKSDADNNKICPQVVGVALRNMNRIIDNFEKKKEVTLGTYMQIKRQEHEIYEQFKGL